MIKLRSEDNVNRIKNTIEAHQKYSTPLIGVIIFLTDEKGRVAVFENESKTWGLPEMFARGDETLENSARRVLSNYVNETSKVRIGHYVLLSGEDYREDVYQFNFILFASFINDRITFKRKVSWISSETFTDLDINSNHRKLLREFFLKGCLQDKIIVPEDPSKRRESDPVRLLKTKKIHSEYFPMPLITVDGLLLKISRTGEFEGIILEKRAKTVQREPNKWVFPAGFVKAHERTSETLAYEVFEETGIRLKEEQILSVYKIDTNPQRDPKWFVWTEFLIAFTTEDLPELPSSAVDEVEDVKVFPLSNLPPESLIGFDHAKVITEFIHFIPYYVTKARQVIEREAR